MIPPIRPLTTACGKERERETEESIKEDYWLSEKKSKNVLGFLRLTAKRERRGDDRGEGGDSEIYLHIFGFTSVLNFSALRRHVV